MRFSSLRSATVKRSNPCIKFLTSKFIYDPCITRANFLYKLAQTVINGTFFSVNLFVPHRLTNPTVKKNNKKRAKHLFVIYYYHKTEN